MRKGRKNISARTKSIKEKNDCFYRNLEMLNILFYVGKGFMLRKQLFILIRNFYKINEHTANDMLSDLLQHGLVIKKQATDTQTCLYILTKFPLTQYKEGCRSTRDATSIKLNNRKIWNNIYRTEFIIREIIPMMEKENISLELQNLFDFLHNYNISIFTSENQISVYQLYKNLYEKFPIKDIEAIKNQRPIESAFMNDYYNLFNMVAAGFFFIGVPDEDGNIILGTFDKCNNMYLKKIYENAICIALMLERYLGYFPHITLQVYMSDGDNLAALRSKEEEKGYDYVKQEMSNINKRDSYFKNYKIPEQYGDFIHVDYIYYPLREKYNLEQIAFFECAAGTFYYNLFVVAVETGLRPGELYALTPEDINFKKKEIRVNKTLVYQKFEGDDGKTYHLGPPKTKCSNRVVPITTRCEAALQKQLKQRSVILNKHSVKPLEGFENQLFLSTLGTPLNATTYCDAIGRIVDTINMMKDPLEQMEKFSGHCFRHTFATRCFEAKIQPKTIQAYLGHATLQMTMDLYTHVTDEFKQDEIEKLENEENKVQYVENLYTM